MRRVICLRQRLSQVLNYHFNIGSKTNVCNQPLKLAAGYIIFLVVVEVEFRVEFVDGLLEV